ncbi:MAG TPA: ABC transporter substrate-binding protein [Acetobacteraceae bacterium]|jgi:peptide/nickel transport system substrate-binding protein|nr:ABC transporter substrate-binding protein [Acetobacteraceae bacterium]
MQRRDFLKASAAAVATSTLGAPAIAQSAAKTLRFVPQANLTAPDPIWTTATVAINHGYMVWDTLYGIDDTLVSQPQMVAGHEISDDKLTWTFTLRDGLLFHDNEQVRAIDCVTSIARWSKRDPFGQKLASQTEEMKALGDNKFSVRLKKPFPLMTYALGADGCFIMPERIASTDAFKQISEYVGSGPFKFLKDEWVAGSKAAWAKFDKYNPRQEKAEFFSGGKHVFVDRVEWQVIPDPATAAAALQRGEVDWVEWPLIDLIPMLKKSPGVQIAVNDPFGVVGMIRFNQLFPPFDNIKLRQALWSAIDQKDFMDAVAGEQTDLVKQGTVGFFTLGSPMANATGMEALTGPRDLAKAKKLIAESGYKGEKIVLMAPTDQPAILAVCQVVNGTFQKLGLNMDYQAMDWGTLVTRRASKEPPEKGGWNIFCTSWTGLTVANPGGHFPLRGNGANSWFGWPTDPKIEALRDAWFDAPDLAAQKKICEQIQSTAFEDVPFIPIGQWFQPTGYRTNIVDIVKCPQILFWNVKKS